MLKKQQDAKTHNEEENDDKITITAASIGARMIHQYFMFIFCSQQLKRMKEKH